MTYRGHIQNGSIILEEPCGLPEGTAVEVQIVEPAGTGAGDVGPTLHARLKSVFGAADDLPEDASENLDH